MAQARRFIRDIAIAACMVGVSFEAGWWAFAHSFADSRQVAFDFTRPYFIPHSHEAIGRTPTADTSSFSAGDRIDIFVQIDGKYEPLILDAVVTSQTKTNFGMLVPYGGRDLLAYARESGWRPIFRLSIAPTDPIVLKSYGG
ncbi:hypothetical protein GCM10023156_45480 [Novipirellula rosea]|uniref:Uncharacterized protein n=1 Tax=Novipirellula rosea TaxID=1031540 RepID=A0ABP8NAI7_9BACT